MEPQLQRRVQRYGWDKAAEYYDNSWKDQLKPAHDKLMEMANLQQEEHVLETACGTGLLTLRAAEAVEPGGNVTATDISEKMIGLAKERMKKENSNNITFYRMDAERLDFQDGTFDAVFNGLGLMYLPNPIESLKETHRVLKPGGRTAIAIWGERKNCGWASIFPVMDKRVATDVCPMFFQQGTGQTLQNSMKTAGFTEIKTERFSVKLRFSNRKIALLAAFAGGPVALAYQKFDDHTKAEAHEEYLQSIEPYRKNSGFEIPGEFMVAKGIKRP